MRHVLCVLLFLQITLAAASTHLVVMGLGQNLAIIKVNGNSYTLRAGQSTPEGVKLIRANSSQAIIEVNGEQRVFNLGMAGGMENTATTITPVVINKDKTGMYRVPAVIDGHMINFILDTGASTVVFNGQQAQMLGIDYKKNGKARQVSTASGNAVGYLLKLKQIKIDTIELYNVEAMVLEGEYPSEALFGMSALQQLEMEHKNNILYLRKK